MNHGMNGASARGVLSLLVHPSNRNNYNSERISSGSDNGNGTKGSHDLHYFDCQPDAPRLPRRNIRRSRSRKERHQPYQQTMYDTYDPEAQIMSSPNLLLNAKQQKPYHPSQGEFTLFFFCEMNCLNSRRFTNTLTKFMHAIQKDDRNEDMHKTPIQLVCVPNDEMDFSTEESRVGYIFQGSEDVGVGTGTTEANILSHLVSQTEYWLLGYDHINRLAVIRVDELSKAKSQGQGYEFVDGFNFCTQIFLAMTTHNVHEKAKNQGPGYGFVHGATMRYYLQ